jgi:hypothetical protein
MNQLVFRNSRTFFKTLIEFPCEYQARSTRFNLGTEMPKF